MIASRVPKLAGRLVTVVELRRYQRTPIDVAVEFSSKGSDQLFVGRATDISLGGMFIEAQEPLAFAMEIVVHIALPKQRGRLALRGLVRWTRPGGMGIQFGLLGARETHAITTLGLSG
jgi:Tfp pilus assembly protein PilZ